MNMLVENFYVKICWNNQVHKVVEKFGEIIRFNILVEKWVDNMMKKMAL